MASDGPIIASTTDHPAVQRLQAFFSAMQQWEQEMLDFGKRVQREGDAMADQEVHDWDIAARAKLRDIFIEYCEAGESASRVSDQLHCGGEPDYNPEKEIIVSVQVGRKIVKIETKMTHNFKFKLRYELVQKDGKWMVRDNRKSAFANADNWSRWPL
jgi:hypothetical protein